jgi:hypothetical protein
LEVDKGLWQDREFVRCVVQSVDCPEYFPLEMQRTKRVGGLLELIELLQPKIPIPSEHTHEPTVHSGTESQERSPAAEQSTSNKPYPKPETYARDQWIYENIQSHTFHTLSLALKEQAKIERWQIISSRNGFKKTAKRYADFHRLPERGFQQAPVTD